MGTPIGWTAWEGEYNSTVQSLDPNVRSSPQEVAEERQEEDWQHFQGQCWLGLAVVERPGADSVGHRSACHGVATALIPAAAAAAAVAHWQMPDGLGLKPSAQQLQLSQLKSWVGSGQQLGPVGLEQLRDAAFRSGNLEKRLLAVVRSSKLVEVTS